MLVISHTQWMDGDLIEAICAHIYIRFSRGGCSDYIYTDKVPSIDIDSADNLKYLTDNFKLHLIQKVLTESSWPAPESYPE